MLQQPAVVQQVPHYSRAKCVLVQAVSRKNNRPARRRANKLWRQQKKLEKQWQAITQQQDVWYEVLPPIEQGNRHTHTARKSNHNITHVSNIKDNNDGSFWVEHRRNAEEVQQFKQQQQRSRPTPKARPRINELLQTSEQLLQLSSSSGAAALAQQQQQQQWHHQQQQQQQQPLLSSDKLLLDMQMLHGGSRTAALKQKSHVAGTAGLWQQQQQQQQQERVQSSKTHRSQQDAYLEASSRYTAAIPLGFHATEGQHAHSTQHSTADAAFSGSMEMAEDLMWDDVW